MKVYSVTLRNSFPVAVVTSHDKVTKSHPMLGKIKGKNIDEVKKLVKHKKGFIMKIYPSNMKKEAEHDRIKSKSK